MSFSVRECVRKRPVFERLNTPLPRLTRIELHGPCAKQEAGLTVNYNTCPMADRNRGLVTVFSRYVRFCPSGEQRSVGFNDWLRAVM